MQSESYKHTPEHIRLREIPKGIKWRKWGPYLTNRQWGTVREDYSESGHAWGSVTHDMARSKAFRWGEEGIGGVSDDQQRLCFSWAFWNGQDPIIKERFFGLSGPEGNHGEDIKELFYYLENLPTHAYMKMLYKYPQREFPYEHLTIENRMRSRHEQEYELIDTGIFDKDEYFDINLEFAKENEDEWVAKATIINRSKNYSNLTVLPTFWFRNTWSSGRDLQIPMLEAEGKTLLCKHHFLGHNRIQFDTQLDELVFCDNESNRTRLYGIENTSKYFKDGINDYIVQGADAINPDKKGTKAAGVYRFTLAPGASQIITLRFGKNKKQRVSEHVHAIIEQRKAECDSFYRTVQKKVYDQEMRMVQRQAFAGLLWNKQYYYYHVRDWLYGDPGRIPPPEIRKKGRNYNWLHLYNSHIISMPDKWEYPWYAAWDLAFHMIPFSRIDPDFAKNQLLLFLTDAYMHPNGQIPAYEWNFGDVNPPVHAWAILRVYQIDRKANGEADFTFLQRAFNRLLMNFTWWINRKDEDGNNIFEGGFLGLDNIGVFDRNHPLVENARLEQADSTGWMAMFALNMMRIALELSEKYPEYQDLAAKFFEHFLYIAGSMNGLGTTQVELWDEEDQFYYDVVHFPGNPNQRMKVRSMVGLIPLFAVETIKKEVYEKMPEFRERLDFFLKERPQLSALVSRWENPGRDDRRLLSLLRGHRMKKLFEKMFDPQEFLSDFGIRALSKYHLDKPYVIEIKGYTLKVEYLPGESDSSFFGGNSNWRGPIWFPVNYLLLESMWKYYNYYGDDFKVEFPKGSKKQISILAASEILAERLMAIFKTNAQGNRPVNGTIKKFQNDPNFNKNILFYEYFHGDNGRGCGASHQTGWTGLIAEVIHKYFTYKTMNDHPIKEKNSEIV